MHTEFWWGNRREGVHLEDPRLHGPRFRWEDNIRVDLLEMGLESLTGLIWLRTGTGGQRL